MTLSAPNNPVDARGKASKRAESGLTAAQHGSPSNLVEAAVGDLVEKSDGSWSR